MRGKPGHRTALSQEWRKKMPRSERRNRKTRLCWKAFALTHLYKDVKEQPQLLSAALAIDGALEEVCTGQLA